MVSIVVNYLTDFYHSSHISYLIYNETARNIVHIKLQKLATPKEILSVSGSMLVRISYIIMLKPRPKTAKKMEQNSKSMS